MLLLPLPGAERLASPLAARLDATVSPPEFRRFPDGESYWRIDGDPQWEDVVVLAALRDPDPQALALLFLADTLREMGARRILLAAPYLPYMRQDARFRTGEAITSRSFGRFVSQAYDGLVTVDPHLHRYHALDQVYGIPSVVVRSAPAIAQWIGDNVERPLIVGPDAESEQWARDVAERAGCPWQVLRKTRHGDRHVEITLPDPAGAAGRTPVLVDDIVSSGHTMAEAARHVRATFGVAPLCVAVHALFAPGAQALLRDAGAARVVSCNTVPDDSNAVDVLPLFADGVKALLQRF
jgi:ribose-phosphate pyrophosphokinase